MTRYRPRSGPSPPVRTPGHREARVLRRRARWGTTTGAAAGGGAIYGLGVFGAWVYFWQQADAFWEYAYAIFQGLFWPAYMVFQAFDALNR